MTTRIGIDLCLKIYGQEVNAGSLCDREKLESALAQPFQSFGGTDLYPTLIEKVARLTFGIAEAQAFQDGNFHRVVSVANGRSGRIAKSATTRRTRIPTICSDPPWFGVLTGRSHAF